MVSHSLFLFALTPSHHRFGPTIYPAIHHEIIVSHSRVIL